MIGADETSSGVASRVSFLQIGEELVDRADPRFRCGGDEQVFALAGVDALGRAADALAPTGCHPPSSLLSEQHSCRTRSRASVLVRVPRCARRAAA